MLKKDDEIGPYTLVSRIGRGGFGEVWLAERRDKLATTQVALKFVHDENTSPEVLKQEAELWAKASGHPNILRIIEANIHSDYMVIVSEYAPDGSLANWLKNRPEPVLKESVEMMLGILEGLEHLHTNKIVHRDLKPANILLQKNKPHLADFGLSRILKTTQHSTKGVGTPHYMPPECFDEKVKLSKVLDIWSAGIILYELLTGQLPFPQKDPYSIMFAIVTKEPEPLPETIPIEIAQIALKAMQKDPANRYKSAKEMKEALEKAHKQIEIKRSVLKEYTFKTPILNRRGEQIKELSGKAKYYEEDLGNGIVLEMVQIPGGSFLMGSKEGEGYDSERPQHEVTVPSFYMGKYQVTQEQWKAMMGNNPSRFKGDPLPVESIKWEQAKEFCKKLSEKTGKEYRLPSEAEWEYACRAGTETPFAFGETITTEIVNYNGNYPYADAPKGQFRGKTVEVGSLGVANQFGLYDMHGNVWEWCEDVWHDDYEGAPRDSSVWVTGGDASRHIVRGGSWDCYSVNCRSAHRSLWSNTSIFIGFRVVVLSRTL